MQPFANELLGFRDLAKVRSQPVRGGDISLRPIRIERGRELQPRQQLTLLAGRGRCPAMIVMITVVFAIRTMNVPVVIVLAVRTMDVSLGVVRMIALGFAEMRVHGRMEVPAKAIDPIVRLAARGQVFVIVARARVRSHVKFIFIGPLIKNGGVIAAMKIGVCFYIKVLGKEPAAITQSNGKKVRRTRAAARP